MKRSLLIAALLALGLTACDKPAPPPPPPAPAPAPAPAPEAMKSDMPKSDAGGSMAMPGDMKKDEMKKGGAMATPGGPGGDAGAGSPGPGEMKK